MIRTFSVLLLLLTLSACAETAVRPIRTSDGATTRPHPETTEPAQRLTFAFWNVENLFDATDDPDNAGDDEFLPANQWTRERYHRKLDQLASVIAEINPHMIGLAEVENRGTLEDLIGREAIVDFDFQIAHQESADHRGIDVALLYRAPVLLASDEDSVAIHRYLEGTRDILEVQLTVGSYPLHVFVNHWTSRWGGTEKTKPKRAEAGRHLRKRVLEHAVEDDLLIIGDFNDEPYDESVHDILAAVRNKRAVLEYRKGKYLYNPTWRFYALQNIGTYYYNRDWVWLLYDQCIVSKGLLLEDGLRFAEESLRIHAPDRMRDHLGRPLRFGRGGKDASKPAKGFSDHFPLVGELVW